MRTSERVLRIMAVARLKNPDRNRMLALAKQGENLLREVPENDSLYIKICLEMADLLLDLGKPAGVPRSLLEKAVALSSVTQEESLQGTLRLGLLEENEGHKRRALDLYTDIIRRTEEQECQGNAIRPHALYMGSGLLIESDEEDRALEWCRLAFHKFIQHRDQRMAGLCLMREACIMQSRQETDQILQCYTDAIALFRQEDEAGDEFLVACGNLAWIHEGLGDWEQSSYLYKQCFQALERTGPGTAETGLYLSGMARMALKEEQKEKGLKYYLQAVKSFGEESEPYVCEWIDVRIGAARLLMEKKEFKKAMRLLLPAREAASAASWRVGEVAALCLLAAEKKIYDSRNLLS